MMQIMTAFILAKAGSSCGIAKVGEQADDPA